MKKRVFYVINLDRSRILTLAALLSGFLVISFLVGYEIGNSTALPPGMPGDSDFQFPRNGTGSDLADASSTEDSSSRHSSGESETASRERIDSDPVKGIPLRSLSEVVLPLDRRNRQESQSENSRQSGQTQDRKKDGPERKDQSDSTGSTPGKSKSKKERSPVLKKKDSIRLANVDDGKKETAPSPANRKKYSFQVGAFSTDTAASRMIRQLKSEGFDPYTVPSGGKKLVRVGKASNRAALNSLEKKLEEKKHAHFLVID